MLECMVAISATSILMLLAISWMHKTMYCASQIKQRQRHHQSLTRLDTQLRNEVRLCSGMSIVDDSQLELTRADGTKLKYTIGEHAIAFERKMSQNDPEKIARERFELSPESVATWDISEMPEWISLVVTRQNEFPSSASETMPIDLQIRVSPNRWQGTVVDLTSVAADLEEQP